MAKQQRKVGQDKSEIVALIPMACSDETAAVHFMETMRWGDTPFCPRCGDMDVYKMVDAKTGERSKRFLWRCHGCKRQFTVRIGTVFEESRIPLRHWCYAFWRASTSKKGASALEIKRHTGITYKSALFLMHRIRFAMAGEHDTKLSGTVEADETYVGGKPRYKGPHNKRGRGTKKTPVVGVVQRNGEVRTRVITDVTAKTLKGFVREHVDRTAKVMTDENSAYFGISEHFDGGHEFVTHGRKEYVRGDAHTCTIDGFWSLLKRGIYGVYHSVSRKHLHRYMAEFEFRYNGRRMEDGERTEAAIRGAEGKRLFYREPAA